MKKMTLPTVKAIALFLVMWLALNSALAQSLLQSKGVTISLTGTSTLHDWEMKGAQGLGQAAFDVDGTGKLTGLSKLNFSIPSVSLKSEHTMMDKNTYKALNSEKFPNISFTLSSATVTSLGNNNYQFNCVGKLTIAGFTRDTDLVATGHYNPSDHSITVTGVKKMKMTDYNVKPPTVMMGTIKTGNDISIAYNVRFSK